MVDRSGKTCLGSRNFLTVLMRGSGLGGLGTGGGGGCGGFSNAGGNFASGKGGSGIVIVRYPLGTLAASPQPKIFLGPLFSYPSSSGTQPTSDGTKVSFARASSQYLNFGSQTFDFTKGLTITCTFAFTGISGNGYERIIDFGPSGYGNNIVLCRNNGTNGLWFSVLQDQYITTSSGINTGTYYNVIASYDS